MTRIPRQLDRLSPEQKRALLAKLVREREAADYADYRPSHGQRSLWFMHRLAPESTVYNVTTAWNIRSGLDRRALRRSFQELVDRHAILRTTYAWEGQDLVQRVHAKGDAHFEEVDAGGLDDQELRNRLLALATVPFALENGPVMRVYLLRRGDADNVLLIVIHHIACDMWSVELLMRDLRRLYLAETAGQEARLDPVTHQYVDFARWQDEFLASADGDRMWRYWRDALGGQHPVVEVPSDRPRPGVQTYAGDGFRFTFDPVLIDRLQVLASDAGTTLFTVLLATFQVLVSRYAQQERVPVGSPLLGRSRHEFEEVVGYFVNPVVLVADLGGDPTFRAFLGQARQTVLDALDHQDYPFPYLVERLQPVRDPSRSPLTDFYFVWDKPQKDGSGIETETREGETRMRLEWGDIALESVALTQVGTPSDLAMLIVEIGDVLYANFGYNTDLFDRGTIAAMSDHYVRLLESVAGAPDARVSELRMLSDHELDQLAIRSEKPLPVTDRVWARESDTLHGSFARWVERKPDAVAMSCGDERITFGELHQRASGLARQLVALGIEPESVVALCVDRSIELVVGILGILKAGAAYLPLDRVNPPERLEFMLQDSGARAVVTRGPASAWLDPGTRPVVDLDELVSIPDESFGESTDAFGDALAYIIYTSGSTGRPKGVEVTHANVLSLLEAAHPYFGFDEEDVWTLFHSAAFDFSVWEIFGALLFGGRLVIVPFEVSRDPGAFYHLLASEGVTVLNQTPSAFLPLIEKDQRTEEGSTLRWIIFGGEALDPPSLRPWVERHGDEHPAIVNMYGITETTVHVTFRRIMRTDVETSSPASAIGRPLPHLHAYVLGSRMEPLPRGVPGELYVGGSGLARGYVGRPELTAERFVSDPFSSGNGRRLYRTGDLARLFPDGSLEYLGRVDQQVKIRGFRIELGEIETVVAGHADVRECVTIAREDAPGDRRLVSYVVASRVTDNLQRELLELTRSRLPDYMVPSAFVVLEQVPLTPNGKLDRKALPAPGRERLFRAESHAPARTSVEEALVEIWEEMLRVEGVGVHDNFFELGGHSILVTRMVDRVRKAFDVEVPVASFFESPTVAHLAREVEILKVLVASPQLDSDPDEDREELLL